VRWDFLCSRPEFRRQPDRGGKARVRAERCPFVTAALDAERIRLVCQGCHFCRIIPQLFQSKSHPGRAMNSVQYVAEHPETNWEEVFRTLSYFDIKNLAPKIKAPVLMLMGLMDDVCPPHINFAAYNNLKCPKSYVAYPYSGHGLPSENYTVRMNWVRKQLNLK
jgi:cephalosporin-C deacetylase-like acetyl esterase